jgi:hypothetical protein
MIFLAVSVQSDAAREDSISNSVIMDELDDGIQDELGDYIKAEI